MPKTGRNSRNRSMPKALLRLALPSLLTAALLGCSGAPLSTASSASGKGPGHEPAAPAVSGMIPAECESLLNKTREWGFVPGQKFQDKGPEQMQEISAFFATYPMVPEASSDFYRAFLRKPMHRNEADDQKLAAALAEALVCDPFPAQYYLNALLDYHWPDAKSRAVFSHNLHQFLLNQQARDLPLAHRAVASRAFVKAVELGYIPGQAAKARAFAAWMEKEVSSYRYVPEGASVAETLEGARREQLLANEIRDHEAALLPLP
jgi:hypothetical protein